MPGDELYDEILKHAPEQASRVVFVSGDADSDAVRSLLARTGRQCISKPFVLEDVASSLFSEPT
jgi:DNA-binding NarL/FixJ family response regulator